MIVTGLWLLVFLVIHVRTFRFSEHPETPAGIIDLYRVETEALASPLALAFYAISMLIVGSHLWHGVSSGFQSLGFDHPRWTPRLVAFGKVFAVVIAGGFIGIALVAHFVGAQPVSGITLDAKVPSGPIAEKWDRHKFEMKLVNPANKRKYTIICVGTGLAGASAAASLGELGYNVLNFCIQDSPRRAHSIAAQGGINAAKNYQNDGDSIYRLFYDTVKGGDYRSREANVYRLAQLSVDIIDQCVAQGVPFAREYGGLLDNRSFGGAQVSRTFYARGQTGQQLLLGAYQSLMRQVHGGKVRMFPRREMLDLVVVDGRARGIITRNLVTGELERHAGDAVILATGGYGTAYYLSTNAVNSNVTAVVARAQARRAVCEPLLHADSPDLHSGDGRSPVEAHADEREPAQRWTRVGAEEEGRPPASGTDSRGRARLLPRAEVPELRQPGAARRRLTQRQAGVRRRPWRRRQRAGRLSRLRRRHQAAWHRDDPGEVRQPLPHVQEDHG